MKILAIEKELPNISSNDFQNLFENWGFKSLGTCSNNFRMICKNYESSWHLCNFPYLYYVEVLYER